MLSSVRSLPSGFSQVGTSDFPFRQSQQKAPRRVAVCAGAELKKPELSKPVRPEAPLRPDAPPELSKPVRPASPPQEGDAPSSSGSGITIEFQRRQAKEMQAYFKQLKAAQTVEKRKVFGWTPQNEILNGRWVMMGIGIGLLTEYATGVDFPNQLKLMLSYLGIADIYD